MEHKELGIRTGFFVFRKGHDMNKSIIRRLDDFGRITLPHDMRRAMHLEESDPVEVVYEDRKITVTPYITLNEIEYFTIPCLKALKQNGDNHFVFTTRNEVCLSCIKGIDRGMPLTEELEMILRRRKDYIPEDCVIPLTECCRYTVSTVFPILAEGDLHGGIVIVSDGAAKPTEAQLVKARFLRDIIAQEVEGL